MSKFFKTRFCDSNSDWNCQDILVAPSVMDSLLKRIEVQAKLFCPTGKTHCLFIKRNKSCAFSVLTLGARRCPPAVCRPVAFRAFGALSATVICRIINTVQGSVIGSFSHIFNKGQSAFPPALTHFYSFAAVIFVGNIADGVTATFGGIPRHRSPRIAGTAQVIFARARSFFDLHIKTYHTLMKEQSLFSMVGYAAVAS